MHLSQESRGVQALPNARVEHVQLHTIGEVCRSLRVGRTKVHALINEGRLKRVKIGRATRITSASLLHYVEMASSTGGQSDVG